MHAKYPFGHLFEHNMIEEIGADSHHGDNGPYNAFVRNYSYDGNMDLEKMKYWSSLGNIKTANPLYAPYQTYDEPPITDRFGFRNNYLLGVIHNSVSYYPSDGNACELKDVSYYYSARPDFLPSSSYSWPALGCNYYYGIPLTQSIPAKDRFNQTKKTYLPNPTLPLITTSGTMFFDQTWTGTVSLTGNVTINTGVTLTLAANSTLNINGYYIKCTGTGKILKNATATINNYTNYTKSGSDYKGFFPTSVTIPQVVGWAASGWNIYVGSTAVAQVINVNTEIPSGITVTFTAGSRMNMNAKLYTTTGTITVQSGATITPHIQHLYGDIIKGLHPTIASAISAHISSGVAGNITIGTGTFSENLTIPNNLSLSGLATNWTTINGTITLNNIGTSQISHLIVNQDIIVHRSSYISIYNVTAKDIIDIENGSNIQIWDSELANYGYMDIYQNAPYIQNITSTYNLSYGIISGDADYTMEDGLFRYKSRALYCASNSDITILDTKFCNNTYDIYCANGSSANVSADDEAAITMTSCPPPIYGSVTLNDPCTVCALPKSSPNSTNYEYTLPLEGTDGSPESLEFAEINSLFRNILRDIIQDHKDRVKYDISKYAPKYNQVITGMKAFVTKYPETEYAKHALKFIDYSYRALEQQDAYADYLITLGKDAKYKSLQTTIKSQFIPYYLGKGEYETALNLTDEVMKAQTDPENALYYLYRKGVIYHKYIKDTAKAEEIYKQVIDTDPNSPMAFSAGVRLGKLGQVYEGENKPNAAEPEVKFAIRNHPNPFNPTTSIQFDLPEADHVTLKVYDITGREVVTLVDAQQGAGSHNVMWNSQDKFGQRVASGMYFYRIEYRGQVLTNKMILMR